MRVTPMLLSLQTLVACSATEPPGPADGGAAAGPAVDAGTDAGPSSQPAVGLDQLA